MPAPPSGPLAQRFPELADKLPRSPLAQLPTPLSEAAELARHLGIGALHIKRDDLSAPVYGGNKVRKLEYLLADAVERGSDAVVTFGAAGSNHVLATSLYARELGLQCYGVLTEQAPTHRVADTLRYHMALGTRLHAAEGLRGVREVTERLLAEHPSGDEKLYRIPWGGSDWRGVTGFVSAALELAAQSDSAPDRIYVATGTMGTTIGLALGLRLLEWPTRVVAVRVVPEAVMNRDAFVRLFTNTVHQLHALDSNVPLLDEPFANVDVRDSFLGPGYGLPGTGTEAAVAAAHTTESLKLEPTYTGKALEALIADARSGQLSEQSVVFWNTYNSRPYPTGLEQVSTDTLPSGLRHYLDV